MGSVTKHLCRACLPIACCAVILETAACKTEVLLTPIDTPPDSVPSITPAVRPIVFSSLRDSTYGAGGRPNREILITNLAGTDLVNLSRNPANDTDPAWSPDGRFIAFASDRNGIGYDIFVMRSDGSDVRQLTFDPVDERSPRWSPDGKRIVFESAKEGVFSCLFCRYPDLYVIEADGSKLHNLTATPAKSEYSASWSPDGKSIAFTRSDSSGTAIYIGNADGTNLHPLHPPDSRFTDDAAAWSPDGLRIAYSAFVGSHPFSFENLAILTVDIDGSDIRLLTSTGYDESARFPSWSPDGKKIVFTRDDQDEFWGRFNNQNIWIMNADGSNPVPVTQDKSKRNDAGTSQAWAP